MSFTGCFLDWLRWLIEAMFREKKFNEQGMREEVTIL